MTKRKEKQQKCTLWERTRRIGMYKRKTIDRWDIETNYGYGWELKTASIH
jgi:hypothetical protein